MRIAGITPRGGQGFPWTYGPGEFAYPRATQHGYTPEPDWHPAPEYQHEQFRLVLTGNPMNDPRPRGPWVSGPREGFPRPASTGRRLPGGQGTDLSDASTMQRKYRSTPP